MRVLVLGSTGMLGSAVGQHFMKTKHNMFLSYRNESVAYGSYRFKFDPTKDNINILKQLKVDYIINCIGTIKPFMASNPRDARYINSVFPWELAEWCNNNNAKLIHITTDCVFSGKAGNYNENALHDALDDYGKSKSLGEPVGKCMVLRTSIIGEEIHKNASLIEWAKAQKGKEVKGFTTHYWNGITTKQYAKVCENIIDNNLWNNELSHIHAPHAVSKYDMMHYLNNKFKLDLIIKPFEADPCDRSLSSTKTLSSSLSIPSVEEQINQI